MALNIKDLIADALLRLCEKKDLRKITIADLQALSGVSRQTFYNHFRDKYDLIQYVYQHRVISFFDDPSQKLDYYTATLSCLQCDARYRGFMQQACRMTGPNSLTEFMYAHSVHWDRTMHQTILGRRLTEEEKLISDYHSAAVVRLRIRWIQEGLPCPARQLMSDILRTRLFSLNELFFADRPEDSPYVQAARHDPELYSQWLRFQSTPTPQKGASHDLS